MEEFGDIQLEVPISLGPILVPRVKTLPDKITGLPLCYVSFPPPSGTDVLSEGLANGSANGTGWAQLRRSRLERAVLTRSP